MAEYIEREAAIAAIEERARLRNHAHDMISYKYLTLAKWDIGDIPAADVRPVVLCRDCINYVESEECNGEKMCVRDADWSVEDGCYYGFTDYPQPDFFCADGKKREES